MGKEREYPQKGKIEEKAAFLRDALHGAPSKARPGFLTNHLGKESFIEMLGIVMDDGDPISMQRIIEFIDEKQPIPAHLLGCIKDIALDSGRENPLRLACIAVRQVKFDTDETTTLFEDRIWSVRVEIIKRDDIHLNKKQTKMVTKDESIDCVGRLFERGNHELDAKTVNGLSSHHFWNIRRLVALHPLYEPTPHKIQRGLNDRDGKVREAYQSMLPKWQAKAHAERLLSGSTAPVPDKRSFL